VLLSGRFSDHVVWENFVMTATVGMGQVWIWWWVFRTVHWCHSMTVTTVQNSTQMS